MPHGSLPPRGRCRGTKINVVFIDNDGVPWRMGRANLSERWLSDNPIVFSVTSCQTVCFWWYLLWYGGNVRLPSSVTMPLNFAIYRPSSVPSRAISEKEILGIVPPSPRGKACTLSNVVLRKFHLDFFYSLRACNARPYDLCQTCPTDLTSVYKPPTYAGSPRGAPLQILSSRNIKPNRFFKGFSVHFPVNAAKTSGWQKYLCMSYKKLTKKLV